MNYPNKVKKDYHRFTPHANRGMQLENLLNQSNEYYFEQNIAVIYKKPTPITISEVKYGNKERIITKAFFRTPSTLDYNGLYRGKYLDFDAKETNSKTSFPLSNLHQHQILHIKNILNHGGIAFLIIYMNNEYLLLDGNNIIDFITHETRKSIPYNYLKEHAYIIEEHIRPRLDYLKVVDQIYFEED